jgi:uncharacterized protein YjbJ (UPF0337 family)
MPDWVVDDSKWKKAKGKVKEQKGKKESDFTDRDWGLVTTIYKNMGGDISEAVDQDVTESFKTVIKQHYGRQFVDDWDSFFSDMDRLVKASKAITVNHVSRQAAIRKFMLADDDFSADSLEMGNVVEEGKRNG